MPFQIKIHKGKIATAHAGIGIHQSQGGGTLAWMIFVIRYVFWVEVFHTKHICFSKKTKLSAFCFLVQLEFEIKLKLLLLSCPAAAAAAPTAVPLC